MLPAITELPGANDDVTFLKTEPYPMSARSMNGQKVAGYAAILTAPLGLMFLTTGRSLILGASLLIFAVAMIILGKVAFQN